LLFPDIDKAGELGFSRFCLSREHILLTDNQYNALADLRVFSGIPHYTLIDKNGHIVLKDAPRPLQKEKLIMEINRQINKSEMIQ
jgi:hypothetical protein